VLGATYALPTVRECAHGHLLKLSLRITGDQVKDTAGDLVIA